jgi:DNA transformation protein
VVAGALASSEWRGIVKSDESFTAFVVEQLGGLGIVRSKSMFGGHGLYRDDTLFGMEYKGKIYFRVSDASRPRYEERGMPPFSPGPGMTMKKYYEVPLDVLEHAAELVRWARDAVAAVPEKDAKSATKSRAGAKAKPPAAAGAAKKPTKKPGSGRRPRP